MEDDGGGLVGSARIVNQPWLLELCVVRWACVFNHLQNILEQFAVQACPCWRRGRTDFTSLSLMNIFNRNRIGLTTGGKTEIFKKSQIVNILPKSGSKSLCS